MWDNVYNVEEYVYGQQPNDFLKTNTNVLAKGKILCLGDGEGRNSVFLARLGFDVTAVDMSSIAIAKAKKLAEEHKVTVNYIHSDLNEFDLGESWWEGIVSIFCHLPAPLRQKIHQRIAKALTATGIYLLEGYTPKQLEFKTGGPPVPEMMYSSEIIKSELPGFNFKHLKEVERDVVEGSKHSGRGHVVQVIAQR